MGVLTADIIRAGRGVYPKGPLETCDTALVLFCAGFYGRQDAIHIADAGMVATCVDTDQDKLATMGLFYPAGWDFVPADAFLYAQWVASKGRKWDLVSLDPFSGRMQQCADELDLWCSLARKAVVLGAGKGTEILVPDGWRLTESVKRSRFNGGVYWTVLEPC